jgi:nucleoside-diphosphate-sugar epimerase
MKKVLVTGVAGFIANKTAEFLLKDGVEVVGIDNMNDYYDVRLKEHRLESLISNPKFTFLKLDIENKKARADLFNSHKFDAVLNLAARAGVRYSMENPDVYMSTNAQGTLNLLNEMKNHGIKKMVLSSTSSLYAGQPMPFNEDLPVNTPISPYAATKKAAEVMAYSYHFLYKMDISIVRYFTVYGPAGRPDMSIFRFIKWIDEGKPLELFGDGGQSRDFTFVDDIARGTIAALKPVGYEIINLGGGNNPISLNTVIGMIEKMLGKNSVIENKEFHIADIKETWANIAKAERILGWKPEISFEEGIKRSVEWHNKYKHLKFELN